MPTILITGAGRGLGRAIAIACGKSGARVAVSDRDFELARQVAAGIPNSLAIPLDVTDESSIQSARARLAGEFGPVDVLINNAGVVHGGAFLDVPLAKHRQTLDVNLAGLVAVTHAFLPGLLSRPSATIANIASASAFVSLPYGTTYAASKAAVLSFSDSLREELRMLSKSHVHVLTACPSFIDTGLFEGARPPAFTRFLSADTVASRIVRAIERRRQLVVEPWSVRLLWGMCGGLPRPVFQWLSRRLGVTTSMIDWKGRDN